MRRATGEGTVYQRKDGVWCGALQLAGRRRTVYGKSQKEATQKLRTLREQAQAQGQVNQPGRMTLERLLRDWLAQAAPRLRPTTLDAYRVIIDKYLVPHLGHAQLTRLDALTVAHYYATLAPKVSKRRLESVHGLLHKVLADAQRWGLVNSNPAALVDAPRRDRREPRLWNPDQVQRFLAAVVAGQGGQYGRLFGFLLVSGARVGEAAGLTWADVDQAQGTVRVARQITEVRGRPVPLPPKTKSGTRTLTLPSVGLDLLRQQRAAGARLRLKAGPRWEPSDRVFPSATGGVPPRRSLRRSFATLLARLELPAVSLHGLRHTNLTLLAMTGVPVRVAQARAGHRDAATTMRVYQHILGDADRRAADALQTALVPPATDPASADA
jgi:integrase